MEINILKIFILRILIRGNIWGGKHMPLKHVTSGLPYLYRTNLQGKKEIKNAIKELCNDEWIILSSKRTGKSSEEHISLNPRKIPDIHAYVDNSQV